MRPTGSGVDLILTGGKIWRANSMQPEAEAVAISGTRISHVGSESEVTALRGPGTRVVELRGRRVVPGFNDAHVHFYYGGASLASVQLRSARSKE